MIKVILQGFIDKLSRINVKVPQWITNRAISLKQDSAINE